ncbi:MAG: glycosyltransferase [Lachnospiraceae bacterium]
MMRSNLEPLLKLVTGKKVLFITTKNLDYLRNTQEIRILKEHAQSLDILCSDKKGNIGRIIVVWLLLTKKRVRDVDCVFVGFEPQFVVPFLGYKFKGKTLIVDFFISVYDTLVNDRKKIKKGSILAKFCSWMDKKTLEKADLFISDTKAHRDYFISEFGGEESKACTIYLEADKNIYYPRSVEKEPDLTDKYVVLYFGSILPLQGVEVVLDAIKKLEGQADVYFDIIGPIPDKLHKPIQDNVRYTSWLSQEELAKRIANCDLCLAGHFNESIDKAKRTIPGKAYIYEAMNKNMILGDGPANHELYEEDERHHFVKMGDAKALADMILQLKESGGM